MELLSKLFPKKKKEEPPRPKEKAEAPPEATPEVKPEAKPEEKVTSRPPTIGETVNLESYRRLQLKEIPPSDIESVIEKEKKLKEMEAPKERDYFIMALAAGTFIFIIVIALAVLTKIDLSTLLGG